MCVTVLFAWGTIYTYRIFLRSIRLLSMACLTPVYFSILSYKRHDFRKKKLLNIKYVVWFSLQLLSVTFPILIVIEQGIIKNVIRVAVDVKYTLFLSGFNKTLIFFTNFLKNTQNTKFYENRHSRIRVAPCGETDVQMDGRRDIANSRCSQFCKRASTVREITEYRTGFS
jgi:hypothetical protein